MFKLNKKVNAELANSLVLEDLTLKEVAKGLLKCLEHAKHLLGVSRDLTDKGNKEEGIVLLIAALEEQSKVGILWEISTTFYISRDAIKYVSNTWRKRFTEHKSKQSYVGTVLYQDLLYKGEFERIAHLGVNKQPLIEMARVSSLYVDFDRKRGEFVSPNESIIQNEFVKKDLMKLSSSLEKAIINWEELLGKIGRAHV